MVKDDEVRKLVDISPENNKEDHPASRLLIRYISSSHLPYESLLMIEIATPLVAGSLACRMAQMEKQQAREPPSY